MRTTVELSVLSWFKVSRFSRPPQATLRLVTFYCSARDSMSCTAGDRLSEIGYQTRGTRSEEADFFRTSPGKRLTLCIGKANTLQWAFGRCGGVPSLLGFLEKIVTIMPTSSGKQEQAKALCCAN